MEVTVGHSIKTASSLLIIAVGLGMAACPDETQPEAGRCPLVPMKLVATAKGIGTSTAVALDAQGNFSTGFSPGETVARYYPQGCLIGSDGPWVDLTPAGELWTLREMMKVDGDEIGLSNKRRLRIQPDGLIVTIDAQGRLEDNEHSSLRFVGYTPQARCCAQVLLTAYLAMMPSMAVSDGVAKTLPPPQDSICRGLPGP